MSARGVKQVIPIECSGGSETVDQAQPASRSLAHADRDRTVQEHDRRRIDLGEFVVESGDLRPIRSAAVRASACTATIAACS